MLYLFVCEESSPLQYRFQGILRRRVTVQTFAYVLAASSVVALVSLISAVFLYVSDEKLKIWVPRLVAVAASGREGLLKIFDAAD